VGQQINSAGRGEAATVTTRGGTDGGVPSGTAAPSRKARAERIERDKSSGLAATRWGRRVIAWSIRRTATLLRRGRTRQAWLLLVRLADLAPDLPIVQYCLARLASNLGDMETAKRAMCAALATGSTKAHRYHCRVAALLLGLQDFDAAEACLESARAAFPERLRVWLLLGELYRYKAKYDDAASCFERAFALAATEWERLQALAGLAGCCVDTGRVDAATSVVRRMIQLAPSSPLGYQHLVVCPGAAPSDGDVQTMCRMLISKSCSTSARMSLHYSLGMAYDRRGEYGESFAHFMLANDIREQLMGRFNLEWLRKRLEATIQVFDSRFISEMSEHGCHEDFLICIVGFPRSGTTLIEHILSSHSDVIGLGERADFHRLAEGLQVRLKSRHAYPQCCTHLSPRHVKEMAEAIRRQLLASAGRHRWVITKLPTDCWRLGLIRTLFPRARIIYCRRHPIDNCLSCYMQHFTEILFSTDLASLADVYRLNRAFMSHWQKVLPAGSIFDCPYEQTVEDPEPTVQRLHDYCSIPFNDDWSRFNHQARQVNTASMWQVRQPIYRTSVEKWRNYAPFLGPLLQLDQD
jgi:tetratricopeptide (TPR) repeat protein